MSTAKDQLLDYFKQLTHFEQYLPQIKCARVVWNNKGTKKIIELRIDYSEKEYQQFLKELEFEFDDTFTQSTGDMSTSIIFLKDNAWLDRKEYDGTTDWELNKLPEIPESLK